MMPDLPARFYNGSVVNDSKSNAPSCPFQGGCGIFSTTISAGLGKRMKLATTRSSGLAGSRFVDPPLAWTASNELSKKTYAHELRCVRSVGFHMSMLQQLAAHGGRWMACFSLYRTLVWPADSFVGHSCWRERARDITRRAENNSRLRMGGLTSNARGLASQHVRPRACGREAGGGAGAVALFQVAFNKLRMEGQSLLTNACSCCPRNSVSTASDSRTLSGPAPGLGGGS